ncbi:hypothetical protein EDB83DRAFT_2317158 [Lactarius deliciosus]|nr:hypothetical protein EDB83DRAFT_2317158 [Lactarius deliciosus]
MSIPRPGTAYLSSRAVLQDPRSLPGHSNVLIFDAVVRPAQTTLEVPDISCTLQYTKRNSEEVFHAGIYDIFATVVTFERDTYFTSLMRNDNDFLLMGDILTVLFFHLMTLRLLPPETDCHDHVTRRHLSNPTRRPDNPTQRRSRFDFKRQTQTSRDL